MLLGEVKISLGKLANPGDAPAIVEAAKIMVARVRTKGELQSSPLGHEDKILVRNMSGVVDFYSNALCFSGIDNLRHAFARPEPVVFPLYVAWEEERAGEDVEPLAGGEDVEVVLHVLLHKVVRVVDVGVVLPEKDGFAVAVALLHYLRVHGDIVGLHHQVGREVFGPAGAHGLQANEDGVRLELLDIGAKLGVVRDSPRGHVLYDADGHVHLLRHGDNVGDR